MEQILDKLIAILQNDTTQKIVELLFIFGGIIAFKLQTAIARVHKIAQEQSEMTGEQKMDKATEDVVVLFGANLAWIFNIPGVKNILRWLLQAVYDKTKPKNA